MKHTRVRICIIAIAAMLVGFATPASAGGPSTQCNTGYLCLSRYGVSSGTTMTYGWRQYTPNQVSVTNLTSGNTFSTSGTIVGGNVRSVRNRDNIYGRMLCLGDDQGEAGIFHAVTANYFTESWKQVAYLYVGNTLQLFRTSSQSSCPS